MRGYGPGAGILGAGHCRLVTRTRGTDSRLRHCTIVHRDAPGLRTNSVPLRIEHFVRAQVRPADPVARYKVPTAALNGPSQGSKFRH